MSLEEIQESNKVSEAHSSEDEDDDKDFLSADEDEQSCIRPAYSVADMLGALSDEEDLDDQDQNVATKDTGEDTGSAANDKLDNSEKPNEAVEETDVSQETSPTPPPKDNAIGEEADVESPKEVVTAQGSTNGLDNKILLGDLEANEIYEGADDLSQSIPVAERDDCIENGQSSAEAGDPEGHIKVTSDISGRFHVVDGSQYQNCADVLKQDQVEEVQPAEGAAGQASLVSRTNTIGEHNYENLYDEVASSGGGRGEAKHSVDVVVVTPVLYTALKTTITTTTTTTNTSSHSISCVNTSKTTNTTTCSVLSACGVVPVPSISDRILSLTSKPKTDGNSQQVSVSLTSGKGLHDTGDGLKCRDKNENRNRNAGRKPESGFPLEASISNKAFVTEAVKGSDPFGHLKMRPGGTSVGRAIQEMGRATKAGEGKLSVEKRQQLAGTETGVARERDEKQNNSMVTTNVEELFNRAWKTNTGRKGSGGITCGVPDGNPGKATVTAIEEAGTGRGACQTFDDISYELLPERPLRNVQQTAQEDNETDVYCSPEEGLQANDDPIDDGIREQIYENVGYLNGAAVPAIDENGVPLFPDQGDLDDGDFDDDEGWSSSEFESFENTPASTLEASGMEKENLRRMHKEKVRSGKHSKPRTSFRSPKSADLQQLPHMIDKMFTRIGDKMDRLGQRLSKHDTEDMEDEAGDPVLMDIALDMDKHPPAELPSMPCGLNNLQVKRRHILASVVESEKNYLDSLNRIVEDYEKPLLELKTPILPKHLIKVIFYKLKDILQCHNMFHIELSESVKAWDKEEKIGNVFIASFSKSMVFESYSAYVNNFSVAMETAKKQTKVRGAFAEFLKQNLENSSDKLSLFGLMVKPVQRFPQFILMMQDLLKHTPPDHHDRIPLQMALTELENLTHKLNETKRESEGRFEAKRIISRLSGRNPIKTDETRYLVRQEDVTHVEVVNGETKTKARRLYLFSDVLICVSVDTKDSDGNEKYKLKWYQTVPEVDVLDVSVSPSYKVKQGHGKSIVSPLKAVNLLNPNNVLRRSLRKSYSSDQDKVDKSAHAQPQNPYQKEVDDMLHDLPVMEHVGQLVAQLRMKYEGLSVNAITGLIRSLQVNIQQKSDMNKCSIQLTVYQSKGQEPWKYGFQTESSSRRDWLFELENTKLAKGQEPWKYGFQTESSSRRRDWLFELENTKLAKDPKNRPGWLISENEQSCTLKLPLFIRPLLIDITRHDTRVECAVPVLQPSPELPGIGVQHLWVCSGDKGRGHVTIVSFHGNQPQVVESFKSCDSPILSAELVPGYACCDDRNAFVQDTVWMALENQSIQVRSVCEEERGDPLLTFPMENQVTCMQYLDGRLYVGLSNGSLDIFTRDQDGVWQITDKQRVELDKEPVTDLLVVDHTLWVACGKAVWVLTLVTHYNTRGTTTLDIQKVSHSISHAGETYVQFIVKAGAGLVVSFRGSPLLRLYHLETMQHLQDVSVSSVLGEIIEGKKLDGKMRDAFRRVHITCLVACKGLLWIGTSVGCVLTLPLPRLEGVPQIKGRPSVSYRAHIGPVKFLSSVYCGASQLTQPELEDNSVSDIYQQSEMSIDDTSVESSQHGLALAGVTQSDTDDYRGFSQSADILCVPQGRLSAGSEEGTLTGTLASSKNLWASTPDLRKEQPVMPADDNILTLYGSLMKFQQEDYEAELLGFKAHKRKSNIPGLGMVTKKATAVNARLSQMMSSSSSSKMPTSPQSKYATLPILMEDCPVYETSDTSNSNKNSIIDSESTSESTSELEAVNQAVGGGASSTSQDSRVITSSRTVGTNNKNGPHKPLFISQSAPIAMLNNNVLGKSHMVISGGEGQINWNDRKALEMKTIELSLLLWQYKQ